MDIDTRLPSDFYDCFIIPKPRTEVTKKLERKPGGTIYDGRTEEDAFALEWTEEQVATYLATHDNYIGPCLDILDRYKLLDQREREIFRFKIVTAQLNKDLT